MGYITQRRFLSLGEAGTTGEELHFILDEREQALPTATSSGRREQSYRNALSFAGTKTATLLRDVPQSIGYVTKELVLDQGAITVNEVVKNISGINQYSFYNDFSIRGFRATGNRNSGNLLNGMRAQTSLWLSVIAGEYRARRGHQGPCLRTLRECCPRWCHQSCDEEAPQYSPSLGIADGWELQYESCLCRLYGPAQ